MNENAKVKKSFVVECRNISTKKEMTISVESLIKQIRKTPYLLERYTYKVTEDTRHEFIFDAWIHPKNGGDDKEVRIGYKCNDVAIAEKELKKYLSRVSDVVTDYKLVS